MLFLDLDRFKVIDDSLGHECGNRLLIAVARRLEHCVRAGDTVGRLGGDELTMLIEDVVGEGEALEAPIRLGEHSEHEVFVSTNIGIVLSNAAYASPAALLRDADVALYRTKDQAKARYAVFETSMNTVTLTRVHLEADLRRALDRREFVLHYQPTVELASGRGFGVEALMRWQHPQRGLIPPAEFIPLAEETGLILPMGRWLLAEPCRRAVIWQEQLREAPTVSVNLSARQFQHPGLVEDVANVLRDTGLDASRLKLEITESVVMEDAEANVATLRRLKALGVHVAIDDFGTGDSSLSYLKRLPIDSLKVDKSLIDGLGRDAEATRIIQAVVSVAHNLRLSVAAEGVEAIEQLAQLQAFGCDLGQGYYFSRPLPCMATNAVLAEACRERTPVPIRPTAIIPEPAFVATAVGFD